MSIVNTPPRPSRLVGPGTPSRSPFRATPTKRAPLGDADALANSMRAFQERHASDYAHLHVTDDDSESIRRLKLEAEASRLEEERRIGREMRERLGKAPGSIQPVLSFKLPLSEKENSDGGHTRSRSAWRPLSLAGKRNPGHSRTQSQGDTAITTQPLRPMSNRPKVARLSMAVMKSGRSVSDSPMRTPTLERVEEHDTSPLTQDTSPDKADVSHNKSTYSWATSFSGETEELRTAAAYVLRLSLDDEVEELEMEPRATPDRTQTRRKRIVAIAHTARQLEGIGSRDPEDPDFWPILERAWNERPGMDPAAEDPPTPMLMEGSPEPYEEDDSRPQVDGRQASWKRNTLTDSPPDLDFKTPAMQDEAYLGETSQMYVEDVDYSYSDDSRSNRYSYASSLHDLGPDGHGAGGWQSRWSGAAGNWSAPPPLQSVPEGDDASSETEASAPVPKLDSPIRLPSLPEGRTLKRMDGSVHQAGLNSAGPSKWGLGFIGGWWTDPSAAPAAAVANEAGETSQELDDAEARDLSEVDFHSGEAGADHIDQAPLPIGPPPFQGALFPLPSPPVVPLSSLATPVHPLHTQQETRGWNLSGVAPEPAAPFRTPPHNMSAQLELPPPPPRSLSKAEVLAAQQSAWDFRSGGQGDKPNASLSSNHFLRQSLIRSMDSCIDQNPEIPQAQSTEQDTLDLAWDGSDAEGEDDSQWLYQQEHQLQQQVQEEERSSHVLEEQSAPEEQWEQEESYGLTATEMDEISLSREMTTSMGSVKGRLSVETMETTSDVHGLVAMIAQAEAMLESRSPARFPQAATEGSLQYPNPVTNISESQDLYGQKQQEGGSPMESDGSQTSSSLFRSLSHLPLPPPRPTSPLSSQLSLQHPAIDFSQPAPLLQHPSQPLRSRQLSLSNLLNPAEEPVVRPIPQETVSAVSEAPTLPPPPLLTTHSVPPPPTLSTSQMMPSRPSSLFCYDPLALVREPMSGDTLLSGQSRPPLELESMGDALQAARERLRPEEEEWFNFPSPSEFRLADRNRTQAREDAFALQRVAVRRREEPELKQPLPVYIDTVSPASTIVPPSVSRPMERAKIHGGNAPASSMAWLTSPATFFWIGWMMPFLWIFGGWVYAPPVPVLMDASGGRIAFDVEGQKGEPVPRKGFMRLMYHPDPWVRACRWGTIIGVPSVMAAGLAVIICLGIIR